MGDADDSYDFSQLGIFYEKLNEGFDIVQGCRFPVGGGLLRKMQCLLLINILEIHYLAKCLNFFFFHLMMFIADTGVLGEKFLKN